MKTPKFRLRRPISASYIPMQFLKFLKFSKTSYIPIVIYSREEYAFFPFIPRFGNLRANYSRVNFQTFSGGESHFERSIFPTRVQVFSCHRFKSKSYFSKTNNSKFVSFISLWKPERSANGEEVLIPSMEKQRFQKEPGSTPESNMKRIK